MEPTVNSYPRPCLIEFSRFGESGIGYISVAEAQKNVPFEIKRVFWTYFTPESIVRGRHAHFNTQQILIAAAGRIIVNTEEPDGALQTFILEKPDAGVYIPPNAWHTMQYSHSAVQLVLASSSFDEKDYIRSHAEFRKIHGA